MTTEQLAALKEVAEKAQRRNRSLMTVSDFEKAEDAFRGTFNPVACAELVREVIRLREIEDEMKAITHRLADAIERQTQP